MVSGDFMAAAPGMLAMVLGRSAFSCFGIGGMVISFLPVDESKLSNMGRVC